MIADVKHVRGDIRRNCKDIKHKILKYKKEFKVQKVVNKYVNRYKHQRYKKIKETMPRGIFKRKKYIDLKYRKRLA